MIDKIDRIDILDQGYVRLIEFWGSDERIIESARMSTGKGFNGWGGECGRCCNGFIIVDEGRGDESQECSRCNGSGYTVGDEKLLRYLWENKHHTPFEMCGATFEIKAPIFVFREWHRHRTQSYNEMSGRYIELPDEDYRPSLERLFVNRADCNKQAGTIKGAQGLTPENAQRWLWRLEELYAEQQKFYQWGLEIGIPKELARIDLPVARYSRMRASGNLRNFFGFLFLREDKKAQWEIRQAAIALHTLLAQCFPRAFDLFEETQRG